jgi:hypothetical protein
MKAAAILLLLMALSGLAQDATADRSAPLDVEFTIKNGEQVSIEGQKLTIKFSSLFHDSRCPTDVVCGWAGNGAIVVEVSRKKKKAVQAMLNTLLDPKQIEYKGYTIRLVALNPYPKTPGQIDPSQYEAVLKVSKRE